MPSRDDYPAWLFLMQHYGLATRLLDWSWAPLTALFFAVQGATARRGDGALWALNPLALNAAQGLPLGLPIPEVTRPLFDAAFGGGQQRTGKILAIATHEVDVRMMVQLSAFTIHDTDLPLERIVGDSSSFLRKYDIPASAKRLLRDRLQLLAIDESHLFPDLEHLASSLNSRA